MVGRGVFFQLRGCAERVCRSAVARSGGRGRQPNFGDYQYSGLIIGLILLASSQVSRQSVNRVKLLLEQGLLLFLAAACAFGQFVIGARLQNLRGQIGRPIDELAVDDSLRVAFNNLHGYSVTILMAAMIAAVIIFFLLAQRARNSENL